MSYDNTDKELEKARKDKLRQWLAASALVPLLCALAQPPNFKPLIYTVFALNYLAHSQDKSEGRSASQAAEDQTQTGGSSTKFWTKFLPGAEFAALFVAGGLMVQLLDLLAYFCSERATVWSPWWLVFDGKLIPEKQNYFFQFGISALCLACLSLVWLAAMRLFQFTYRQIFLTSMAFGMLTVLAFVLVSDGWWVDIATAALESGFYYASIVGIALTPLSSFNGVSSARSISLLNSDINTAPGGSTESSMKRCMKYASTIMALIVTMALWKVIF